MPEDQYGAYVFDYNFDVNNNIYVSNPLQVMREKQHQLERLRIFIQEC